MDEHLTRAFWQERWRAGRTPWDLGRASAPARHLIGDFLSPGSAVIIPGCGRGYEALLLAEQGHRVTALDFVAEPIAALRRDAAARGLTLEALEQDIFALPASRDATFDAVLEQTCLPALGPTRFHAYEALFHRLLKPGGRLLAVLMELTGVSPPPFTCTRDDMQALFSAPRWRRLHLAWVQPPNPARPGPEYTVVFEKV